jgi:dTDP-4-dehydrorhamnose reductase
MTTERFFGRVLITGATGRLGGALCQHFRGLGANVIGACGRRARAGFEPLDLASESSIRGLVERAGPEVVIHAAAMTNVDACEQDEASAVALNVRASDIIAEQAARRGARYVYISSDYVFDGESGPYLESSVPNPISTYGRSKLAGEKSALAEHGAVVRVAILYGHTNPTSEPTLVSEVVSRLEQGRVIALDGKRIKYPTLTEDVARALEGILRNGESGIFHCGNPRGISRYEWGRSIAASFDLDERLVVRDDTVEQGKPARRPVDVELVDTRMNFVHTALEVGLARLRRRRIQEQAA